MRGNGKVRNPVEMWSLEPEEIKCPQPVEDSTSQCKFHEFLLTLTGF